MKDSIININFTNAVKQAERIDQVISRLEKASISLGASMDTLGTVWKGKVQTITDNKEEPYRRLFRKIYNI